MAFIAPEISLVPWADRSVGVPSGPVAWLLVDWLITILSFRLSSGGAQDGGMILRDGRWETVHRRLARVPTRRAPRQHFDRRRNCAQDGHTDRQREDHHDHDTRRPRHPAVLLLRYRALCNKHRSSSIAPDVALRVCLKRETAATTSSSAGGAGQTPACTRP